MCVYIYIYIYIYSVCVCVCVSCSVHVQLFTTPWTVAHQVPLSMRFSRQEYWSGLSFPSPGDLPAPGIEPRCPALQADSLPTEPLGKREALYIYRESPLGGRRAEGPAWLYCSCFRSQCQPQPLCTWRTAISVYLYMSR